METAIDEATGGDEDDAAAGAATRTDAETGVENAPERASSWTKVALRRRRHRRRHRHPTPGGRGEVDGKMGDGGVAEVVDAAAVAAVEEVDDEDADGLKDDAAKGNEENDDEIHALTLPEVTS